MILFKVRIKNFIEENFRFDSLRKHGMQLWVLLFDDDIDVGVCFAYTKHHAEKKFARLFNLDEHAIIKKARLDYGVSHLNHMEAHKLRGDFDDDRYTIILN